MGKNKKRVDTHALLSEFHGRQDYADIARRATDWASENRSATKKEFLAWVREAFSVTEWLTLTNRLAPLAIFG